jgi:anaerobic selenocysteine-containing dehydrogenase
MAPREGLKAVQMFDAIARGDIKALWVVGTNPAASLQTPMPRAPLLASSNSSSSPIM